MSIESTSVSSELIDHSYEEENLLKQAEHSMACGSNHAQIDTTTSLEPNQQNSQMSAVSTGTMSFGEAIDRFDDNGDNHLQEEEFFQMMRFAEPDMSDAEINQKWEDMDAGSRLGADEYDHPTGSTALPSVSTARSFDADGNDHLDIDEFRALMQAETDLTDREINHLYLANDDNNSGRMGFDDEYGNVGYGSATGGGITTTGGGDDNDNSLPPVSDSSPADGDSPVIEDPQDDTDVETESTGKKPIVVLDFDRTLDHGPGDNEINPHAREFILNNKDEVDFIIVSANGSRSTIKDALEDAGISDYIDRIYHDTGDKTNEFNDIASDYGTDDYRYFFLDDKDYNIDSWQDSDLYDGDNNYLLVSNDGDDGGTAADFDVIEDWIG